MFQHLAKFIYVTTLVHLIVTAAIDQDLGRELLLANNPLP